MAQAPAAPASGVAGQLQALDDALQRGALSREEHATRRRDIISERLAGVDALRQSGLISDAEHAEQRRRVLNEM